MFNKLKNDWNLITSLATLSDTDTKKKMTLKKIYGLKLEETP